MNGTAPLHLAAARGDFSIVSELIRCGANTNLKMKQNSRQRFCLKAPILTDNDIMHIDLLKEQTALDIARKRGDKKIINLLQNHED